MKQESWFRLWYFQQYFTYIVAVSFIGGGNWSTRRKPPTCRKSLTNFITYCCIEHTSPWTGFQLTTLVVIGTGCMGGCKSNYHTITSTTIPWNKKELHGVIIIDKIEYVVYYYLLLCNYMYLVYENKIHSFTNDLHEKR